MVESERGPSSLESSLVSGQDGAEYPTGLLITNCPPEPSESTQEDPLAPEINDLDDP